MPGCLRCVPFRGLLLQTASSLASWARPLPAVGSATVVLLRSPSTSFHPFSALQGSPRTCPLVPGSVRSTPCNASIDALHHGLQQEAAAGGGFKLGADTVFLPHPVYKTVLLCLQPWSGSFSPRRGKATRAVSPGTHVGEHSSYCIHTSLSPAGDVLFY